jgi:long-subunit acyl-CoA synthetase (AMP-forming)
MSIIPIFFEEGPIVKLTIYYDGQFYVGIVETVDGNTLRAYRNIFGPEPKDQDVLEFIYSDLLSLIERNKQKGIITDQDIQRKINPKRLQRMVSKEIKQVGFSTKAQEALKEEFALRKKEKVMRNKQLRDKQKQDKREKKILKAKNKHRGK